MNEHELQDALKTLLETIRFMDDDDRDDAGLDSDLTEIEHISTFEDAGILTRNAGLVVTAADGSEFQITIIRSR